MANISIVNNNKNVTAMLNENGFTLPTTFRFCGLDYPSVCEHFAGTENISFMARDLGTYVPAMNLVLSITKALQNNGYDSILSGCMDGVDGFGAYAVLNYLNNPDTHAKAVANGFDKVQIGMIVPSTGNIGMKKDGTRRVDTTKTGRPMLMGYEMSNFTVGKSNFSIGLSKRFENGYSETMKRANNILNFNSGMFVLFSFDKGNRPKHIDEFIAKAIKNKRSVIYVNCEGMLEGKYYIEAAMHVTHKLAHDLDKINKKLGYTGNIKVALFSDKTIAVKPAENKIDPATAITLNLDLDDETLVPVPEIETSEESSPVEESEEPIVQPRPDLKHNTKKTRTRRNNR